MEIPLDVLKRKTPALRAALGVVRVPRQTRQHLDEEIPGLGGQMCTGGNQRCLSALFPGHKDERNGKQLTRCNTCRKKSTRSLTAWQRDRHGSGSAGMSASPSADGEQSIECEIDQHTRTRSLGEPPAVGGDAANGPGLIARARSGGIYRGRTPVISVTTVPRRRQRPPSPTPTTTPPPTHPQH